MIAGEVIGRVRNCCLDLGGYVRELLRDRNPGGFTRQSVGAGGREEAVGYAIVCGSAVLLDDGERQRWLVMNRPSGEMNEPEQPPV